MKVTGAEFMDWYDNHFPEGYYHESDDGIETHGNEGEWLLDATATYDTNDLGYLAREERVIGDDDNEISIESQIKKYRKARDNDVLVVTVPKDQREAFDAFLKSIGGKVTK